MSTGNRVFGSLLVVGMRSFKMTAALIFSLMFMSVSSCGYYSTSGRTAGDIKKIAVPYLKNDTAEPDIEIDITQRIIDALIKDNTLKVVSEDEADAILEGSIIEYKNVPFTFSENNESIQAEQYRLVIGLNVSLFSKKKNAYIWENKKISAHGDYYLESNTDQTYEKALDNVYNDIVESILSSTVQEW